MCADEADRENFEEMVRSIVEEVGRSVERMLGEVDVEEIAGSVGVNPDRAREWVETAGTWLRSHAEGFGDEMATRAGAAKEQPQRGDPARPSDADQDPLRHAGPSPRDVPSEEQGLALAALESGRWVVEPGSNALAARGGGAGPSDSLGLYRELLVRDWISTEGEVTLVGHHALGRWVESSGR